MSPPEVKPYLSEVMGYFHEAGGLTSEHDIEIFRAWKLTFPRYTWNRASVDRFDGLRLFQAHIGACSILHFSNANCGDRSEGSRATVTILQEVGFGSREELEAKLWVRMHENFSR